jgi:hypothetical protein
MGLAVGPRGALVLRAGFRHYGWLEGCHASLSRRLATTVDEIALPLATTIRENATLLNE